MAKFESPEGFYTLGLEYFKICDLERKLYTLSGLALHLGLSFAKFSSFATKNGYSVYTEILKTHILNQAESALYDKNKVTGARFHALQLGMVEKVQVDSKNTNINTTISEAALQSLSNEDLHELLRILGNTVEETPSPPSISETPVDDTKRTIEQKEPPEAAGCPTT